MNPEALERLLTKVRTGTLSVATAIRQLRTLPNEDLGFASVDHHRSLRQGVSRGYFLRGEDVGPDSRHFEGVVETSSPLVGDARDLLVSTLIQRLDR